MAKSRSTPSDKSLSLSTVFASMSPAEQQSLSATLMAATFEAQGLISDMLAANLPSMARQTNTDPFGSLDVQAQLGMALARRPDKVATASMTLIQGWSNLYQSMLDGAALPRDRRFSDPEWSANPAFEMARRAWMLNGEWLLSLVDLVSDQLDEATQGKARFFVGQMVDALSPSNLPISNPAALRALAETGGDSLLNGLRQARADIQRGGGRLAISQTDEEAFELGKNIATAKGEVVFRNQLIEVIHYKPAKKKVYERPLLIIPPWINKFYILDLQPENSMIRWLLLQRIDTFVVSWRSADESTKHLTWDDYLELGIDPAIDAVRAASGAETINTVGYCIGGTLLTSALAHMAKTGDKRVHSATYFASQADFSHAGDLKVFTDDAGLAHIDGVIETHGGLMPGELMGDTFNWLRPSDLVWRYVIDNYMLGKPPRPFDLLYWNADQTNIPGPTHRTYLKEMYNQNSLSTGKFDVFGEPVSMRDITIPVFVQASRADHICPWESIYRGAQNFRGDTMFTLAGSGHIAGVINPPAAKKYQFWFNPDLPENPGRWLTGAEETPGSWWPHWFEWLEPLSGELVAAQPFEESDLGPAPGQFAALRLSDIAEGKTPAGPFSKKPRKRAKTPAKKPATKRAKAKA